MTEPRKPAEEFEEALRAYGKKSQEFRVDLVELCDLGESFATVMVTYDRAIEAARREVVEKAAAIGDLWVNSQTCTPGAACDHQRQGAEIAKRIRALCLPPQEPADGK